MTATKIQHPATKAFVTALLQECAKMGLTPVSLDPTTESGLRENGGWCFLRFEGTHESGASLIIPKAVHRLGNLHSHVDLSGRDGYVALPKKNGKVICHLEPTLGKVVPCLSAFLSAAKRATAAPTSKSASQVPVVATPTPYVGSLDDVLSGEVSADMWNALCDASEEDLTETVSVTS